MSLDFDDVIDVLVVKPSFGRPALVLKHREGIDVRVPDVFEISLPDLAEAVDQERRPT